MSYTAHIKIDRSIMDFLAQTLLRDNKPPRLAPSPTTGATTPTNSSSGSKRPATATAGVGVLPRGPSPPPPIPPVNAHL